MENKFYQIGKSKENKEFLKANGFKELGSAIFDKDAKRFFIISTAEKNFLETCESGIEDAEENIKEMYNQEVETLNTIESCLN